MNPTSPQDNTTSQAYPAPLRTQLISIFNQRFVRVITDHTSGSFFNRLCKKICYVIAAPFVYLALLISPHACSHHNWFKRKLIHASSSRTYVEGLIKSNNKIPSSEAAWVLNLALLRLAKKSATTEAQHKQLDFLISNYLSKAAPIQLQCWKDFVKNDLPNVDDKFASLYQVTPFDQYWYHRESWELGTSFCKEFNESLAFGSESPFILTDSLECSHLFPLKYTVLQDRDENQADCIKKALQKHFFGIPPKTINEPLDLPFIFDLSHTIGDDIKTCGELEKTTLFTHKFNEFKERYNTHIKRAVQAFINQNQSIAHLESTLQQYVINNTTCLSFVEGESQKGIKILPLQTPLNKDSHLISHLREFVHLTGLYISAVNLRRLETQAAINMRSDVEYNVTVKNAQALTTLYYPKKTDFTHTKLFQRMTTLFHCADARAKHAPLPQFEPAVATQCGIPLESLEQRVDFLKEKPHTIVLGKATMDLLQGLMQEIQPEVWEKVNNDPALCQSLQGSLFRIREHLANAEIHALSNNFAFFAQEIELIHTEITAVLELTSPFKEDDFPQIYTNTIQSIIPDELKQCTQASLGKTASTIFSGINVAILTQTPSPERIYGKNIYFEQLSLIGDNHYIENFQKDINLPKANLYVGQFNSNISISTEPVTYQRENVAEKVKQLFTENRAAEHLTVAVDCTIDKSPSSAIKDLLEQFKEEIKQGKLNFIFFKSGQKFDMLGMDNYYGAPFFMVNNGEKHWKPFDQLVTHPFYKTDALSNQWFCLSNKYAFDSLSKYKELIFKNTREILDHIPPKLVQGDPQNSTIRIQNAQRDVDSCFIDIKVKGESHNQNSYNLMKSFYKKMDEENIKVYSRQSFGFFHPSYLVFGLPDSIPESTTRLTPGINPEDNKAIIEWLQAV